MHDIKEIRENPAAFDQVLGRRGLSPQSSALLALDTQRRAAITAAEAALAERNAASKQVGAAKASGNNTEFERLRTLVAAKKAEIAQLESDAKTAEEALNDQLMRLPNAPFSDVPDGQDEADNIEIYQWGTPRQFDFEPKEHFDIGEAMGLLDLEAAAKLSGARFMVLKGALARLHRALGQFMIDTHIEKNGLTECWVPVLVKEAALYGTSNLPKFAEDLYKTEDDYWLIPTAEVPLTNLVSGQIVEASNLPQRYTAWTQCFRSEAGSAGRDVRGILRQHQFEKVEMVTLCVPEESEAEHERMTECAQGILEALELPYRKVVLCTGDMGFGARKTYDLEVWVPGQQTYREISSCSNCGDFQARRMNARCRKTGEKQTRFLHSLNGSGLAIGRCLIAVLENGQQADGSVTLPKVLAPYLGGKTQLNAEGKLV